MLPPTTHILSSVFVSNYRGRIQCIINMDLWIFAKILLYVIMICWWRKMDSNPLNLWISYCPDHSKGPIVYPPDREWLHVLLVPSLTNDATHLHWPSRVRELGHIITIIIPFMHGYQNLVVMEPPLYSALSLTPNCSHKIPSLLHLIFCLLHSYVYSHLLWSCSQIKIA